MTNKPSENLSEEEILQEIRPALWGRERLIDLTNHFRVTIEGYGNYNDIESEYGENWVQKIIISLGIEGIISLTKNRIESCIGSISYQTNPQLNQSSLIANGKLIEELEKEIENWSNKLKEHTSELHKPQTENNTYIENISSNDQINYIQFLYSAINGLCNINHPTHIKTINQFPLEFFENMTELEIKTLEFCIKNEEERGNSNPTLNEDIDSFKKGIDLVKEERNRIKNAIKLRNKRKIEIKTQIQDQLQGVLY